MNDWPTSRQLNLYVDGELAPEEVRSVEAKVAQSPQLQAQVDLERRLKQRVAAVLQGESAPADLARRLSTRLSAEFATAPPRRISPPATRRPWWRAPQRANVFAIAATLCLVAGAVLVGIFGPSIDSWSGGQFVDATQEAAAAVAGEHAMSTADVGAALRGLMYRTPDETSQRLAPLMGGIDRVTDLSDLGYDFAGSNTCNVPHCQRGCHIYYTHRGDGSGMVSLTVVADGPHIDLRATPNLPLPIPTELIPQGPSCSRDVLVWTYGQSCYLLVVCVPEDALLVAQRVQDALRTSSRRAP